jgi:hypothetical protein
MIIFLSYASEQRDVAEQTKLALASSGHKVFFDRDSLPIGNEYHLLIRKAVEESEAFVFLISPQSVAQGCYALTELKYAREKWPDPQGKVLPVMVERTEYRHIPPYLKAISVLEPEGNAPAEIAAEIQKWSAKGIQDVVKLGGKTLKSNAVRFIAVLAGPRNFIKSIDHKADHALIDASVFGIFISVVNLTINLPAYRLANVKADTLTYVLTDTVITFVFWFLYGSVYHLCARLVGGRGTYQSSIVAVLYLTAFTVISGIFSLPLSLTAISWSLESSDVPSLSQWQILGNQILQSPTGLICALLSSATILYRWICTIGVFMIIHEVGRAKAIFICLLAASLSWVVLFTVEKPATALFWRAFSN